MGALGTPLLVQILSFSCSFQDIICWRTYPVLCLGNPGSATVMVLQTEADPDFPVGGGANPPRGYNICYPQSVFPVHFEGAKTDYVLP